MKRRARDWRAGHRQQRWGVLLLLAVGCTPHKVVHDPAPPVDIAASYSTESNGSALPQKWWRDFQQPELDRLVRRALEGNLGLEAAWARLQQAQAVVRAANGGKWPALDASFSAQRQKFRSPFADADGGAAGGIPETFQINQFNGSLAASYEVDLWRRVGSRVQGSVLDALAARDATEALAMSIAAEVCDAYFDLSFERARKNLLEDQIGINETFLELTNLRFRQGLASALDIYQQQRLVTERQGQLALVDAAISLANSRLAVLTSVVPSDIDLDAPSAMPDLPKLPGVGLPADLLVRRADVRAARRLVEAADYRVAAAVADRLPGLRLQTSLSVQNGEITKLFDNFLWTILGAITVPLFRGGQLTAEVDRNRAIVRERLALFGDTLISAVAEVENALVLERQTLVQIGRLEAEVEIAGKALTEARHRYREGLSDFLPVLTALGAEQSSQLGLLQAHRNLLGYRVQLMRALGGTWTHELSDPALDDSGVSS